MPKHQLIGKIISNKMLKTLVVQIERTKEDPKYKRRYRVRKNYKVHNENGDYKVGDKILIEECRPISKDKKWKAIKKIASDIGEGAEELEIPIELEKTEEIKEIEENKETEETKETKETKETEENDSENKENI